MKNNNKFQGATYSKVKNYYHILLLDDDKFAVMEEDLKEDSLVAITDNASLADVFNILYEDIHGTESC
tara:strand:+ start:436 stop:639 length:204 start_codon:yes stop_codon:yes gene_type:complete